MFPFFLVYKPNLASDALLKVLGDSTKTLGFPDSLLKQDRLWISHVAVR